MLAKIACIIEIIAIIVGLFGVRGKRFKIDVSVMCIILVSLFVFETITTMKIPEMSTVIFATVFFLYDKLKFKESFIKTGVNIVCVYVITIICQFIGMVFTCFFISENAILRALCVNVEVLLFNVFVLPRFRLHILIQELGRKSKYVLMITLVVGSIALLLLVQSKGASLIRADMFIFVIPIIPLLIILLGKWNNSQQIIHEMEKENIFNAHMKENYDKLVKDVRARQHEFKNHMLAIFSTHYTYKTYEQLVRAQEEYCNKIRKENRYNNLLLIENKILAGYLYEKFQEIEEDGICLEYRIHANLENVSMPVYNLIEIIGILIDNAVEALKTADDDQKVTIEIRENTEICYFIIRNKCKYVPYSQIIKWFELDYSSKGEGRGIGLFYVKSLCEKWNCDILCENVEIEKNNWIQFTVSIQKSGNQN